MYFVYIIQSGSTGMYYVGSTDDLDARLKKHNSGQSKYTKNRGPWKIVYSEILSTRSQAVKREYYIKSLKSRIAIQKLIKDDPIV